MPQISDPARTPRYLIDTNVLSAGAPGRAAAYPALADWMDRNSPRLYLSAITIAEIEEGIAKARRTGAARKAKDLADWLETLLHLYGGRVLAFDCAAARILGPLADRVRAAGHAPGFADLAIAATAKRFGATILTRNLRHFAVLEIGMHDPFAALPAG